MISVVLPAYNEEPFLADTVDEVVAGLRRRGHDFELLIVENGSTDGTLAVAEKLAARYDEVRPISVAAANYGHALRRGFLEATGDVVANFDVDYFDLDFLDAALARMATGDVSLVVAAKRGEGANDTRAWSRRLVTSVFAAVLRVGFGLTVDTHGMKVMDRVALAPYVEASGNRPDLYDTEVIIRAERAGLGIIAIPVVVEERRASRTSIFRRIPRSVRGLGRLWQQLRREARLR